MSKPVATAEDDKDKEGFSLSYDEALGILEERGAKDELAMIRYCRRQAQEWDEYVAKTNPIR